MTLTMSTPVAPVLHTDQINARILEVSEDQIRGFREDPIEEIARQADLDFDLVLYRLKAMLSAGTIRRIRQTLNATNLAPGALIAWQIPPEKLQSAFDFLSREDPFSGHVVIRTTDSETPGSSYRLWTTLKVPESCSVQRHCDVLARAVSAEKFRIMPAKRVFVLGVGHIRRKGMEPGARSEAPAEDREAEIVELSDLEWQVLMALKREFATEELGPGIWRGRAREAGMPLSMFLSVAHELDRKKVIGRFSTFLEHVKPVQGSERLTRCNGLFHWAVPPGREIEAGREIGRHLILTHCYWRDAGPEFGNVNIMAVAHGMEKDLVLAHKAAIDRHLETVGIPVSYTNVFWGGRSEIKPSEISRSIYLQWCQKMGFDPECAEDSV